MAASLFSVIGGLGIFMLGMKYMSEGLQAIAGNRLRTMIGAVTNNRLIAVAVGTGVTCIVQSSSVTTVMAVGFVNAGFMTLSQSIGVIMGANVGTTVTGWILVLKIGKFGLPILGLAALVFRFCKRDRLRFVAMAVMGVGMIFFGLELMKKGFAAEELESWLSVFSARNYPGVLMCALVGCVATMIVQSSSAMLGMTIGAAMAGSIQFETAAALVLGENIGTTITAYIASLGTTTNARRAAYAHAMFNITGVIWITALFFPYIKMIREVVGPGTFFVEVIDGKSTMPNVGAAIAMVHTIFNITNMLLFLPFTGHIARLLTRIVPDRAYKESPHLTHLDSSLIGTPVIGIEQSRIEILRMADTQRKMLARVRRMIIEDVPDDKNVRKIFHKEEVMDVIQKEVTVFLTDLLVSSVAHEVADEARRMLRMADEYESASDYARDITRLRLRLFEANLKFPPGDQESILALHDEVEAYMEMVTVGVEQRHAEIVTKAHTRGDGISHRINELRDRHIAEVAANHPDPLVTVIYTNMLNAYLRVKDHALNVAESLAGEK